MAADAVNGGYNYASSGVGVMDSQGMDATLDDVERLLTDTFERSQHRSVREQLARLEDAPLTAGDAARIKVAALLVAEGRWPSLVESVELGLTDWRDLLVAAFYADHRAVVAVGERSHGNAGTPSSDGRIPSGGRGAQSGSRVIDAIVEEGLRELADKGLQRRLWLGHSKTEISSFTECVAHLFTDSGLGDALDGQDVVYAPTIDDRLRDLKALLASIDGHSRDAQDVIEDPRMDEARIIAQRVLEDVRALGGQ